MFRKKKKQLDNTLEDLNKGLEASRAELEELKKLCAEETNTDSQDTVTEETLDPQDTAAQAPKAVVSSVDTNELSMAIMSREAEFLGVIKSLSALFETTTADNRAVMENVKQLTDAYVSMQSVMVQMAEKLDALSEKLDDGTTKIGHIEEEKVPADTIESDLYDLLVDDTPEQVKPSPKPSVKQEPKIQPQATKLTREEREALIRKVLEKRGK